VVVFDRRQVAGILAVGAGLGFVDGNCGTSSGRASVDTANAAIVTTRDESAPAISPDGKWLAYTSNESGDFEVYVSRFSPNGAADNRKWPVSTGGGWAPVWARTGRELFYQNRARQIFAVAYRGTGDSFTVQKPRLWSETRLGDIGVLPG
jgi:serine/threonine-protein kinase